MALTSCLTSTVAANPGLALGTIAALCVVLIASLVYLKLHVGKAKKADGKADGKAGSKFESKVGNDEKDERPAAKKRVKFVEEEETDAETEKLISMIEKK